MHRRDYARLIVDAASVRKRPNIYYLMPFAERLSFVAQQQRAFNLIWALNVLGMVRPNARAAVIGSGLAGVAASCALAAAKCSVTVFETAKVDMVRQRNTHHRMAHPEINYWPEISTLTHTSRLPMLHWHFDTVANAVTQICEQKQRIYEEHKATWRIETGCTVDEAMCDRLDGVVTINSIPECRDEFDLAIVCIGFEDDRDDGGHKAIEYWSDDKLEDEVQRGPRKSFIVSGAGDGGMIDALRCAYLNFQRGTLAVRVAQALSDVAHDIRDAERREAESRHQQYLEITKLIFSDSQFAVALKLFEFNAPASVVLLDKTLQFPSDSAAAPIHKLMVYCAIKKTAMVFHGQTPTPEEEKGHYIIKGRKYDTRTTRLIIRHGAPPRVGNFLYGEILKEYQEKQKYLSRYNLCALDIEEYDVAAPFERSKAGRLQDRKEFAEKALSKLNNNAIISIKLNGTASRFEVRPHAPLAITPTELFGVPVSYSAPALPAHRALT